ncbi:hypothetical protein KAOT1_19872 [Kordia algicida OT-1]|uniref:Uncharacterized protein n=1 Tax=Kordia algicida OT-1 TaxID=391587 RepID=A9DPK3_9FLAO|nr:hypothetical protein KAOT1_19872 [Kordia algicida OT-1]
MISEKTLDHSIFKSSEAILKASQEAF